MFELNGVAYPVRFANYQQNSYVPLEAGAKGTLALERRYDQDEPGLTLIPLSVLIQDGHVGILSTDNLLFYQSSGQFQAMVPIASNTPVVFGRGASAYVEPGGLLNYRDYSGTLLLESANVPALKEWTFFHLLKPGANDMLVAVQFSGGPKPLRRPPRYDVYRKSIEKSRRSWSYDGEGLIDRVLLSGDDQTLILIQGEKVQLLQAGTGQLKSSIESGFSEVETASLDLENNLVMVGQLLKGETSKTLLKVVSLSGEPLWQYPLKAPQTRQPPACGASGRVFLVEGRSVKSLSAGELNWEYALKSKDKTWLTVAKDNRLIVVNGRHLILLSPQGEEIFSKQMTEDGERFDAPAAVDSQGRIYVSSDRKLYVYQ